MSRAKKRTALVVDDQPMWRDLLVECLEDRFDVASAPDYESALDRVLKQDPPFHVVVTDIRLVDEERGNEDGLRLASELRRLGDRTQVVVVTGYPTVETAKRALGKLKAYDYLEKAPESGEAFEPENYLRTVEQAAELAEQLRPEHTLRSRQGVLVVEGDETWRLRLAETLRSDGYEVRELDDPANLGSVLGNRDHPVGLVVVDEAFATPGFLAELQKQLPDVKFILLSLQDMNGLMETMENFPVLNVLPLRPENFRLGRFRESVHRAFAAEAIKYVSASFEPPAGESEVRAGVAFQLTLRLEEERVPGAISIWLPPQAIRQGGIIKVFTFAPKFKLQESESHWRIPASGHPAPLALEMVALEVGEWICSVELEQDYRWLGRIERHILVS